MEYKKGIKSILFWVGVIVVSKGSYAQCPPSDKPGIHIVQKGENVYRIGLKYGVTKDNIIEWNRLSENEILPVCKVLIVSPSYTGQPERAITSRLPEVTRQQAPYHVVREGETIETIARFYGYTEIHFRAFNSLRPGERVAVGSPLLSTDCKCEYRGDQYSPTMRQAEFVEPYKVAEESTGSYPDDIPILTPKPEPELSGEYQIGTSLILNDDAGTFTNKKGGIVLSSKQPDLYMRAEEVKMIEEINLLRSNPAGYIPFIDAYIQAMRAGGEVGNSFAAAEELKRELMSYPTLSPLIPLECLYYSARNYGKEQANNHTLTHQGADGTWPWDRILRDCDGLSDGTQNIIIGPSNIQKIIITLLIDESIPNRGHRKNLLSPAWKYISCYNAGRIGGKQDNWLQLFAR